MRNPFRTREEIHLEPPYGVINPRTGRVFTQDEFDEYHYFYPTDRIREYLPENWGGRTRQESIRTNREKMEREQRIRDQGGERFRHPQYERNRRLRDVFIAPEVDEYRRQM